MTVPIALIAAVARNGVIGADGAMPWRLSTDMKRFRELTVGKPVIMGRRTFATLKKPLADRLNLVVTRDPGFGAEGAEVVSSLDAAIARAIASVKASGASEVMVIGGGQIYAATIDRADRLYITLVDAAPEGDTRFPAIDPAIWAEVSRQHIPKGEKDSAATDFVIYRRRKPGS
ncbi:MAG: dihydrofolate reductase [Bauldia sp.]